MPRRRKSPKPVDGPADRATKAFVWLLVVFYGGFVVVCAVVGIIQTFLYFGSPFWAGPGMLLTIITGVFLVTTMGYVFDWGSDA